MDAKTLAAALGIEPAAIDTTQQDPRLPVYHFKSPAGWMGDVNGPLYHQGYYHLFYQYKPSGTAIGWGHARSTDLVHWEHLPMALKPAQEAGETHCYSGAAVIRQDGTPMLFYTSKPFLQQNAAVGDAELITWQRHPDNPLLPDTTHRDQVQIGSWRDPFIFVHKGQTYIVVGGWEGAQKGPGTSRGIVSLYKADNPQLTGWTYIGPLFYHPDSADNACPNFFRLGNKWLLLMSRHNPHVCDYLVGTWDESTGRFEAEFADALGYTEAVYATQGLYDSQGRLVIWNTLDTHRTTGVLEDWPGCLTLPRLVTLAGDGRVGFAPHPALEQLRQRHCRMEDILLDDSSRVLDAIQGDTLEICAEFEMGSARAVGLHVRRSTNGERAVEIRYEDALRVDGTAGVFEPASQTRRPLTLQEGEQRLTLRVFLDKAAVEVFINGRACFEKLIHPKEQSAPGLGVPQQMDVGVEVFAEGGSARAVSVDSWTMRPI